MKLIVENIDGQTYAYLESASHFKRVHSNRTTVQKDPFALLPNECRLDAFQDTHFVFDVKDLRPKAKPAAKKKSRGKSKD